MAYLLDSDVFIRAKNLHYGFDFCPAFWNWLIHMNRAHRLYSVEKVRSELIAGADELSDWVDGLSQSFFLAPDESTSASLAVVSQWVVGKDYSQSAIATFLQVADYFLVSQAHAGEHTVVTHEVPSGSSRRIKIPDVCLGLHIPCMSPYEVLRNEHARFVLAVS